MSSLHIRRTIGVAAALLLAVACTGRGKQTGAASSGDALVYPRVLFLTTGSDGLGQLPSGANICLEAFNGLGAFAEVADKSVLLERARLDSVRIIVAPTIAGYHDGDRLFSLSFLDSAGMANLAEWVRSGGILIAGENIGRNTVEGEDRAISGGVVEASEWPLAEVFGYSMREVNLTGFRMVKDSAAGLLDGYRDDLTRTLEGDWLLVPAESAGGFRTLARWTDGSTSYPAVTANPCGRGWGILVPHFLLLQPSIDGGAGDASAIAGFWRGVFALALGDGPAVCFNPWPGPYRSALAVTLNEAGGDSAVPGPKAMLAELLRTGGMDRVTVFATGLVPGPVLDYLKGDGRVELASLSFRHPRFSDLDYCRTLWELARFEDHVRRPVRGFRFPFSNRTAAGMFILSRRGYKYESSIHVDHATGYAGALFPYNIPTWVQDQYCLVTSMLELSPTVEDWSYFGAGALASSYPKAVQERDAQRFGARLQAAWRDLVRARRGMMVLSLHALYSGHSPTTLAPAMAFLAEAAGAGDVWLAGLEDIADWWNARRNVDIRVQAKQDRTVVSLTNRNPEPVRGLTIRLDDPALNATARGVTLRRLERTEDDGVFVYLTFDLVTDGEVEVHR
ncbi:MAG: hypothetical protein R6X13_02595 [bacterium]